MFGASWMLAAAVAEDDDDIGKVVDEEEDGGRETTMGEAVAATVCLRTTAAVSLWGSGGCEVGIDRGLGGVFLGRERSTRASAAVSV
jgi:hypothetical protein